MTKEKEVQMYIVVDHLYNKLSIYTYWKKDAAEKAFNDSIEDYEKQIKEKKNLSPRRIVKTPTTFVYEQDIHVELVTIDCGIKRMFENLIDENVLPEKFEEYVEGYLGSEAL